MIKKFGQLLEVPWGQNGMLLAYAKVEGCLKRMYEIQQHETVAGRGEVPREDQLALGVVQGNNH